jgi:glycosyltransferase involved in cell wall biosynthesis
MRILLDATPTLHGPSGTAVYVERLATALEHFGVEVVRAANTRRGRPGGGPRSSARNLASDVHFVQRVLPRRAVEVGADLIHHTLPAHAARAPCPQVVTVHDLAFAALPDAFDPGFRAYAQVAHRTAARRADAVVCVSETTACEALARWRLDRVTIARHGPGQALPAVKRRKRPTHFLYVGDDEPRKDLDVLRAAARKLPLVLAGSAGQRVDQRRLAELHAGAYALVHPARLEGFGLTVLEAMQAGTPVIAARSAAVAEIAGDAALLVEPGDPRALRQAMRRVRDDAKLRAKLSERGRERAAAFSWHRSAQEHIAAYRLALSA